MALVNHDKISQHGPPDRSCNFDPKERQLKRKSPFNPQLVSTCSNKKSAISINESIQVMLSAGECFSSYMGSFYVS